MAPLACDPTALDHAGATVVAAGESLGSVISTLTAALAGTSGMAGDDPVGAALGRRYDGAAAKLIQAMADTRNGLCSIGDGVRMSAHNYAVAEAMSDLAGRASALPAPQVTGPLTVGAPPSAVGHGSGAPAGWGWVAPYIGMIWPTGDSAKLRAAAAAWATAGANFMAAETAAGGGTMAAIGAQQIPEGAAINKALADVSSATADVARQCQTIAAQLNSYAAKVDQVHAAILDLLSRICDPLTGIKEVWDLLTDEDEDEIKKIADDIRTVVDNFGREAETLGGQIEATVSAVAAATENMSHWAGKEWDHFLHGTPVGRALNQVGQAFKGVGEEGWGFLKGLYEVSPNRMLLDPVGYGKTMAGMVEGAGTLVGLGPDGVPGAFDAWKALGKDVTHWDEWGSNPAEALGKSTFDVATLALPGGPLSKLGKVGHTAADALKGLKKPPGVPKPPEVKPPAASKAPDSGQPAPSGKPGPVAPSGKPAPGPADGPLPHSPTESKPPAGGTPPAAEPPKPTAAPHAGEPKPIATPPESVGKPVTPAPAGDGETPAVPAAAAGLPVESTAAAATHLPTPPSLPMGGGAPPEAPSGLGEVPHAGEPNAPPTEPHGGGAHPPGDGTGPPHPPGDGGPHSPGDGNGPRESHPGDGGPHSPGDGNRPHDSHPGDDSDMPGDHHLVDGSHNGPPRARDVFPDAKEFGELSETEYRELFEDENGRLRYPDVNDPAKPYAIPGTVRDLTPAEISALHGQWLDRIGRPGGRWLAFEGTPYEGRALPHTSLEEPYYAYKVDASAGLPPGWKIEFSLAAPWFGHPGGEPQLLIIAPQGQRVSVQALIDRYFLNPPKNLRSRGD
ncbi:glycohydrolase toxin TNT-related protein [Mycobacterium avium]|uniref:glycohydrolase toxin TNT-related protein n=1 Tax=Mycobacterium avium TaxID=1764 RepID=UPI000CE34222|nr:glycohydrolase toxin TNT-related protein [Mycobacterium avium]